MRKRLKNILLTFVLLAATASFNFANAQDPPTDPCNTPGNPDEPPAYCPIDGGLTFLLLAGAAYGIKKYRGRNENEQEQSSSGL